GNLLSNFEANLIRPAFNQLNAEVETLAAEAVDFVDNSSAENLQALQEAWIQAFTSWQAVSAYNFGPGDRTLGDLNQVIGTFPVNTAAIEQAIIDQDFSLDNFQLDVRGFLAIEYLIFNSGDNQPILNNFNIKANSTSRKQYLLALINHVEGEVDDVTTAWNSFGATFLSQDGTDVGSSVSLLYNDFVASYEQIKNFKVGLPAGKRPGQTTTSPEKVEAFFSGQSISFLKAHFNTIVNIWQGIGQDGQDGVGFREYLLSVEGGAELVESTELQIEVINSMLNALPENTPLSQLIESNPDQVDQLHTELQRHTRFFKSDMSSLLGLSITFNSGDGD
ncbi:MAG: imelysin family protein, partial [Bacteroidota bacterium]